MQTTSLTPLRIGGVPEHFNLPWHLGVESGAFAEAGIDLQWRDCPGGTGEMVKLLEDGELDLVVTLTEGSVAAIARGLPMKALQWYVTSPLQWGVHVGATERARQLQDVPGRRVAVSRMGSGSHLMAAVLAEKQGWSTASLEFVVVGNLEGAVQSFREQQADLFLWERFTTQPLVNAGHMRRIDICPTPWPAFLLCASTHAINQHGALIAKLQEVIAELCQQCPAAADFPQQVAERYALSLAEVKSWQAITRWSESSQISPDELDPVAQTMARLGLIENHVTGADCV
jgi:ABC-type nitrate/sulfonate/bicarbonate transport system substrate-binding protein